MIEDVFFKRYRQQSIINAYGTPVSININRLLVQMVYVFFQDVNHELELDESFFASVHNQLARDIGCITLNDAAQLASQRCMNFITEEPEPWSQDIEDFFKLRLSLVELLFREAEKRVRLSVPPLPEEAQRLIDKIELLAKVRGKPSGDEDIRRRRAARLAVAIDELNDRFKEAEIPLHYHNGLIQYAIDDLSEQRIAEPFWSITRDLKWANVDQDMKEAIDRADTGGRDPTLYAAKALESTIKIISDEKGWTTGRENGAAAYIDNLVKERSGRRFIETWEMEALKMIFTKLRNPHGHGPGRAPQPVLAKYQTAWVIETCMSWIKSLIMRL